jgi:hypothetical protein
MEQYNSNQKTLNEERMTNDHGDNILSSKVRGACLPGAFETGKASKSNTGNMNSGAPQQAKGFHLTVNWHVLDCHDMEMAV